MDVLYTIRVSGDRFKYRDNIDVYMQRDSCKVFHSNIIFAIVCIHFNIFISYRLLFFFIIIMSKLKSKQISKVQDVEFEMFEMVFCKMRGYSRFWPSRIIFMDGEKVIVEFFGDNKRV